MGCRNTQIAFALVAEFLGNLFDAFNPTKNFAGFTDDNFATRRNSGQVFAAASKYFQSQFVLQKADLFGNTGLRGEKALGRCRHIEVMMSDLPDVTQLL